MPFLLALALASPAALRADIAQTLPGTEVLIKVSTPAASVPRFGFAPMRVSIENASAVERTWRAAFQVGARQQFPGLATTSREFIVPAGQTREAWVFVPIAEPSTNAGNVVAAGSPAASTGGITYAKVTITPIATGTKISRVLLGSGGAPFGTEETVINATTGERTTTMISTTGGSTSSNSSKPPAGANVTYVIDPITGTISSRYSGGGPTIGGGRVALLPTKVDIITSTNPAMSMPGSTRRGSVASPKVTIVQTPIGTKVSREISPSFTLEQEIDATTGAITTTYAAPAGRSTPAPRTGPPVPLGREATITIDQTTGNIRTSTRLLPDSTAPAKIIIITAPAAGATGRAALVSASGALATPVVVGGTTYPSLMTVEFAGPGLTNNNRLTFNGPPNMQMRPLAVSGSLEPTVRGQLSSIVRGAPNLSAVEPTQLPADWRVWSSFAAVLMTSDEFASLDAGRRAALRGWVGLGGRVWLFPLQPGAEHVEKLGVGTITTLADPLAAAGPPASAALARSGAVLIEQSMIDFWVTKLEIYNATPGLPNASDLLLEKTPLGEAVQERPRNNTWLAIFLVGFAAIVGPVNLFVFAPAAKRHRLFYTTPLIALAAVVVLGLTILLQDGLGGDGARRALVVLLPGDNQAAVIQEQASVTGFLTHRTFPIADDTQLAVIPLDAPDPRMNGMQIGSNAELTRAESRGVGDWFRSRGRQAQLLQRLVPTRGRVERAGTAPDGAPIVQSSLGTTLREFVLIDEAGKFWAAAELLPGKRVTLTVANSSAGTLVAGGSRRFADVIGSATPRTEGHWRARGGATDLAPIATLDTVRWTEAEVLFAGVIEAGPLAARTEAKR